MVVTILHALEHYLDLQASRFDPQSTSILFCHETDSCMLTLLLLCLQRRSVSGKTHTMSGGVGLHGKPEEGITLRVIRHIFAITEGPEEKGKAWGQSLGRSR